MPYAIPLGNAVNFNLQNATPPLGGVVNFDLATYDSAVSIGANTIITGATIGTKVRVSNATGMYQSLVVNTYDPTVKVLPKVGVHSSRYEPSVFIIQNENFRVPRGVHF